MRWRCACGEAYRVSGSGRHRIYWVDGAPLSEPVMDGCCPRCGRELPGKQSHRRWGSASGCAPPPTTYL